MCIRDSRVIALGIGVGSGYLFETTFKKEVYSDLTGERGTFMGAIQGLLLSVSYTHLMCIRDRLINDRFEILEIHLVNVVYCFKRVVDNLTVHVFRNDAEGMEMCIRDSSCVWFSE